MTESSAAAAVISTVQVSITLPHLKPDSVPPPDKAATARVQQILNDFAKADNKARIFDESGVFGPHKVLAETQHLPGDRDRGAEDLEGPCWNAGQRCAPFPWA